LLKRDDGDGLDKIIINEQEMPSARGCKVSAKQNRVKGQAQNKPCKRRDSRIEVLDEKDTESEGPLVNLNENA
jgi:hypothetical protein